MQVNKDVCIGCGVCASVAGNIFKMEDGKSILIKIPETAEEIVQFKLGQSSCPVAAIEGDPKVIKMNTDSTDENIAA